MSDEPITLHTREQRSKAAAAVVEELAAQQVRGVALTYVDTAGITRVKAVPLSRFERAAGWGVGMSPVFDTFLSDDSITSTDKLGGPDGDVRLMPDVGATVPLFAQPGWAWAPVDRLEQDGTTYAACQRSFARRMTETAAAAGLTAQMAFEIEWAIGKGGTQNFEPACTGPAYGMTRLVELSDYSADLLEALDGQGVQVEQIHPEYAAGQYELSVGVGDPVEAADISVLVRQTVRAVSLDHDLQVSFAPSVVPGTVGNGGHVHASVWRDGVNLLSGGDGPYGLTTEGEAFLAGVLEHLVPLLALGAPTPASYLRLVPSHWAGAYAAWGHETRETALRLVTGTVGTHATAANMELKCIDLAANPYLVTGGLIAAGLDGVRRQLNLPPSMTGDPSRFSESVLAELGVRRLPTELSESVDAFAADQVLREALGDTLADAVIAVRRAEIERFAGSTPEQVAAALRWVF